MKKFYLLIAFFSASTFAFCQHETDKWYFGHNTGLDFSSGIPVVIANSAIFTDEGCSAISDTLGHLLFYTDGETVYDTTNLAMPNGTGLLGGFTCTQAAVIVPKPGSTNFYYIFTAPDTGGIDGFRYSIVDMTLNGGLGNVVSVFKNIQIKNNVTEKLCAVKQSEGTDFWIAVHGWGSDSFFVYRLSPSGLNLNPVVSTTGIVHNNSIIQNTYGQMKFSPCGDKLAVAVGYLDTLQVFDFNNSTGDVTNPVTIPLNYHPYGIEFSQDAQKLYATAYDPGSSFLYQYDLSSGVAATIVASQSIIFSSSDCRGLQLANDGKIYVCKSFSQFLGVVNNPSISSFGCNYVDNAIDLDPAFFGHSAALSLTGFPSSYLSLPGVCSVTATGHIEDNISNNIFPNPADDHFTIRFSQKKISHEIEITNSMGKIIEEIFPSESSSEISFGKNYAPGIYFVSCTGKGSRSVMVAVKM